MKQDNPLQKKRQLSGRKYFNIKETEFSQQNNFNSRALLEFELWPVLFYLLINGAVKQLSDMKTILLGTTTTVETKTDCEKQQKDHRLWSNKTGK